MLKYLNMIYVTSFPGFETCLWTAIPPHKLKLRIKAAELLQRRQRAALSPVFPWEKAAFSWSTAPPEQHSAQNRSRAAPLTLLLFCEVREHFPINYFYGESLFAHNTIPTTKHPFPSSISYAQDRSDNTIVCQMWLRIKLVFSMVYL